MGAEKFDKLEKVINAYQDNEIYSLIPKKILNLNEQDIGTISFVFWICYLGEIQMDSIIGDSWVIAKQSTQGDTLVLTTAQELLNQKIEGKFPKGRQIDLNNLQYFGDKLKVINTFSGDTDYTRLMWELKKLRDDISHTRISDLKYNKESLNNLNTKKTLLIKYIKALNTHKAQAKTEWE